MANPEHVKLLRQGTETWNRWREQHPDAQPNLAGADLTDARLSRANLSGTKLSGTNLKRADLRAAVLSAETTGAAFVGADLEGAHIGRLEDAIRLDAPKARWSFVHVGQRSDFDPLHDPEDASYWLIRQGDETLQQALLRRVVEESTGEGKTRVFHSCFISYSHTDKSFARRLHNQLQARGIRCWLDEHDLKPGDRILDEVGEAIRHHDKILLCCSKASLKSWWVKDEIRKAMERERQEGRDIIIPLMIDRHLLEGWDDALATDLRARVAADFTGWQIKSFRIERHLEQLIRALRKHQNTASPDPEHGALLVSKKIREYAVRRSGLSYKAIWIWSMAIMLCMMAVGSYYNNKYGLTENELFWDKYFGVIFVLTLFIGFCLNVYSTFYWVRVSSLERLLLRGEPGLRPYYEQMQREHPISFRFLYGAWYWRMFFVALNFIGLIFTVNGTAYLMFLPIGIDTGDPIFIAAHIIVGPGSLCIGYVILRVVWRGWAKIQAKAFRG